MSQAPKVVRLGGQQVTVPVLAGPVGRPGAAYPTINQPNATAQVDAQFELIAELRNAPVGQGGVTPAHLAIAQAVANYRADRAAAIGAFQDAANVGTAAERADRVITPDGKTWQALYEHGYMASRLDTLRDNTRSPRDYVYSGRFDHAVFATEAGTRLQANPATRVKYYSGSLPNFDRMLTYMENDMRLFDIRWMAYMFGTAYWEAAETVVVGTRPDGRKIKQWNTVTPIDETGLGRNRDYGRPVKVERLGPTRARITEWDGDQIEITEKGYDLKKGQDGGAEYSSAASPTYTNAKGDALTYFGRGYVQLTWWYHYAMASVAIGRQFDLLWDPELAKDPDIAYLVMADGMLTGRHYANRRRIQTYIAGGSTNYTGARAIVNSADPQPTIVQAAQVFEAALLAARR